MYSRAEICSEILEFYSHIIRHPYLDDDALIIPPAEGWSTIYNTAGKDATVVDLLRHLPYLHRSSPSTGQLLIYPGTIPICHRDSEAPYQEQMYPLPAHCVYLARRADYLGRDLILDTSNGTVTEFSYDNPLLPEDEYEMLPEAERWRAHPTVPIPELLCKWTRMYEELDWMVVPNPIGQPETGRFYKRPDDADFNNVDYEGGSELDMAQGEARRRKQEHAAKVYDAYIRHGWPNRFDKERCRAELLVLEKAKDAEDRRIMDENNPDAALFE
ncbi:hypothetical protein GGR55DRAFT_684788 [Xylaria sp. FL0064]|nr:hypothetical protein GGR55DRAFT_684788 [Xylaria sp. FL0064]